MLDLSSIHTMMFDDTTKGVPAGTPPFALSDVSAQGWNIFNQDMPFPLMVLRQSALDHNMRVFRDYLDTHNLSFAPHGKTTMSPQIFDQQLRAGAWGITAATVDQMQVMLRFGVKRILIGNQIVGAAALRAVARAINSAPDVDIYCFVDSSAQLDNMASHLANHKLDRPLHALVEVGAAGGRTGLRDHDAAIALAQDIAQIAPGKIAFSGVACFEGAIPDADTNPSVVTDYANAVVAVCQALPRDLLHGMDEFVLTGGGSAFFDLIVDAFARLDLGVPHRLVLRSGCYITNDHGAYAKLQKQAFDDPDRHWKSKLQPALEVWGLVQSRPEPDLAFLTMGKRDIPFDAGFPVPIRRYVPGQGEQEVGTAEIFATNDQHAYVRLSADSDWQVGDMICVGISHPCTAFDKWRLVPVVDDAGNVIDGYATFF